MYFILLYGPPAAGKLTVAKDLSQLTGYKLLDNHKMIDYIIELFPRSEDKYYDIRTDLGRKIRLEVYGATAKADVNVISTMAPIAVGGHDFIRDIKRVVESAGGKLCLVHLLPEISEIHKRVTGPSRVGWKLDNVERWQEVAASNPEVLATFADYDHLVLDNTNLSPRMAAEAIISYYQIPVLQNN